MYLSRHLSLSYFFGGVILYLFFFFFFVVTPVWFDCFCHTHVSALHRSPVCLVSVDGSSLSAHHLVYSPSHLLSARQCSEGPNCAFSWTVTLLTFNLVWLFPSFNQSFLNRTGLKQWTPVSSGTVQHVLVPKSLNRSCAIDFQNEIFDSWKHCEMEQITWSHLKEYACCVTSDCMRVKLCAYLYDIIKYTHTVFVSLYIHFSLLPLLNYLIITICHKEEKKPTFNNLDCSCWFAILWDRKTLTEPYNVQSHDRLRGASQNPFGSDSVENTKISNTIKLMRNFMRENIHTQWLQTHKPSVYNQFLNRLQLFNVIDRTCWSLCVEKLKSSINTANTSHRYSLILRSRLTLVFFIKYGRYGKINQFNSSLHISKVLLLPAVS